ncbi:hypothetical protein KAW18_01520 [candidate division WOR-3 bacterium]|nr:hypothetical protein [candidate division WOR-3 bacterium]
MSLVTELRKVRLSEKEIISLGKAISGGVGFWGHEVRKGKRKKMAEGAWIKALREKGLTDVDIALYGDWSDGRHIGDGLTWDEFDTKKKMIDYVKAQTKYRTITAIKDQNNDCYDSSRKLLSWVKRNKPRVLEKVK